MKVKDEQRSAHYRIGTPLLQRRERMSEAPEENLGTHNGDAIQPVHFRL